MIKSTIGPIEVVQVNMVQLINYCRITLGMSEISIMQLWHMAFAASLELKQESPPTAPPSGMA